MTTKKAKKRKQYSEEVISRYAMVKDLLLKRLNDREYTELPILELRSTYNLNGYALRVLTDAGYLKLDIHAYETRYKHAYMLTPHMKTLDPLAWYEACLDYDNAKRKGLPVPKMIIPAGPDAHVLTPETIEKVKEIAPLIESAQKVVVAKQAAKALERVKRKSPEVLLADTDEKGDSLPRRATPSEEVSGIAPGQTGFLDVGHMTPEAIKDNLYHSRRQGVIFCTPPTQYEYAYASEGTGLVCDERFDTQEAAVAAATEVVKKHPAERLTILEIRKVCLVENKITVTPL